ncbi:MAG: hypothetical protein AB1758_18805 [Candidatus Eremiobacterota bacterium]
MNIARLSAQPVNDLYAETRDSIPGLVEMLKDEREQWEPIFRDIVAETLDGGQAALDEVKSLPALPEQGMETALAFLEGGLVAGSFGAMAAYALRSSGSLSGAVAGQTEALRHQLREEGRPSLERTLAREQDRGRALYEAAAEPATVDGYRALLQEAFVAGYRVGASEALLVLG